MTRPVFFGADRGQIQPKEPANLLTCRCRNCDDDRELDVDRALFGGRRACVCVGRDWIYGSTPALYLAMRPT